RVGFLLRGTFETGTMDLDPVDPRGLGTPDRMRTPTGSAMINVGVNFGYEATPRFMVGANFDLFGITVGQGQNATLTNAGSGGETAVVPVKPDSPNLFEGGGDKGSLNSELFVGWALNDRYTIRGGLSRQLVQYRLSGAQAITASSTNYSRTANVIFIGLRYTPPQ
ncbi:MAG TPA: hypothetical protein VHE13_02870, partial [Opitutus sp.]|nr:hypothetical protein [Opitutus sp.]